MDRIRETSRRGMWAALAHWNPEDLRRLADLFQRMVDDFVDYAAAHEPPEPPRTPVGHDA
ncbi:hypothetical protein [Streptomyces sp. 8K308]|uniref:hypothetical protein n=1 Tax=Streptomyces sp. 8K308 TaxID=2530388 RepID=UPI00269E768F